MTRTPILDRLADALVGAIWWLDRRTPGRCPSCRAWVQHRHHDGHRWVEHGDETVWGD